MTPIDLYLQPHTAAYLKHRMATSFVNGELVCEPELFKLFAKLIAICVQSGRPQDLPEYDFDVKLTVNICKEFRIKNDRNKRGDRNDNKFLYIGRRRMYLLNGILNDIITDELNSRVNRLTSPSRKEILQLSLKEMGLTEEIFSFDRAKKRVERRRKASVFQEYTSKYSDRKSQKTTK